MTTVARIVHHQRWLKMRKFSAKIRARFGRDVPEAQIQVLARMLLNDRIETREAARRRRECRLTVWETQLKMFDVFGENNVSCYLPVVQFTLSLLRLQKAVACSFEQVEQVEQFEQFEPN